MQRKGNILENSSARAYIPLLILEDIFPQSLRQSIKHIAGLLVLFLFVSTVAASSTFVMSLLAKQVDIAAIGGFVVLTFASRFLFIALSVWLIIFALEAYYYSNYFSPSGAAENTTVPSYEVAYILYHGAGQNFLKIFFETSFGREIVSRSGISCEAAGAFAVERASALGAPDSESLKDTQTLRELAEQLARGDVAFHHFLLSHEVTDETFIETAAWVERRIKAAVLRQRWWSRDKLRQIHGLGEGWGYGETFLLERLGRDIEKTEVFAAADSSSPYGRAEADSMKNILARTREANVLLVGEAGIGILDVVGRFARDIAAGLVEARFAHKRIFLISSEAITTKAQEKATFEKMIQQLFDQAIAAGNIILVLENLPNFIESATVLGVDFTALIDHYLSSDLIQVIATSDLDAFQRTIAKYDELMKRFDIVSIKEVDQALLVRILQDAASIVEKREELLFTYPAVQTIAVSAEQYFPYGVMPDKALDLVYEVATKMVRQFERVVRKENVLDLITERTKIPIGSVARGEREKLEHLEVRLYSRVVGQEEAVRAVASALRRARSGLITGHRPVGAFLFLGPTGVGKTETAKAIAAVYFDNEELFSRLDLSEYATGNALERLIGSLADGSPGVLASMLREHPYGVLLLDEFEKASREVRNLFLQVFEEGFFSDVHGKRVYAQNLIIIATSNAGAERIWDLSGRGENPVQHRDEIIDMLIQEGTFAPELLNRFDGVIMFHPLEKAQLREIAKRFLGQLAKRLMEQGITLVVSDVLVDKLVVEGYDLKFGARPMRRALQEHIEEPIAKKIIAGELEPGGRVDLASMF